MGAVPRSAGRSTSERTATLPIRSRRDLALAALAASALCLLTAPAVVGGSYSWVEHTTSESAAQGIHGAWLARLGFVLLGIGVAAVAAGASRRWRRPPAANRYLEIHYSSPVLLKRTACQHGRLLK